MATLINVRALNRSKNVRVDKSDGTHVTLSQTADTKVDVDDPAVRRSLAHHQSIGAVIVTGAPTPA